jgi:hypothetical protein
VTSSGLDGTVKAEPMGMTERKPPDMSFVSWVDQQISEAAQRGAFDNLPGAGRPLPRRTGGTDAWLQDYLRREGLSAEEMLPTPLRLRKEIERLTETVHELASEQQVREVVAELNRQIVEWRRIPVGPPVFLPRVDEETMVRRWRGGRPAGRSERPARRSGALAGRSERPAGQPGTRTAAAGGDGRAPGGRRVRWWRRFARRGTVSPADRLGVATISATRGCKSGPA